MGFGVTPPSLVIPPPCPTHLTKTPAHDRIIKPTTARAATTLTIRRSSFFLSFPGDCCDTCCTLVTGTACASAANAVGATSDATCTACEQGTISPSGSTSVSSCVGTCPAGFTGPAGNCVECVSNTYKSESGSTACTPCGENYVSGSGQATCKCVAGFTRIDCVCTVCPANSASPEGSVAKEACVCVLGYTPGGSGWVKCAAGKYGAGAGSCSSCPAATFSTTEGATSDATCGKCDGNANSPIASSVATACRCNQGYTGINGASCNSCDVGTYKTLIIIDLPFGFPINNIISLVGP